MILLILILCIIQFTKPHSKMQVEYQWSYIDYKYANESDRLEDIKSGIFQIGKAVLIDVDIFYENDKRYVIVTMPRFREGIPATLGFLTDNDFNQSPLINPYFWEWQRNYEQCNYYRIVSVYRIFIDEQSRLWVLDTGIVNQIQYCSPQILVFDLKKDQLIRKYDIPDSVYKRNSSILVSPVVEVKDKEQSDFRNTFVYIADITEFGLIIYDVYNNKSWRIEHNFFYPHPGYGHFTINNESFDLMDGLISLVISDDVVYFHSLASNEEYSVKLEDLKNSEFGLDYSKVKKIGSRISQSAAQTIDQNGVIFFGLIGETSIGCWNAKFYKNIYNLNTIESFLERSSEKFQFPSGMKVARIENKQELWVSTCRFQKVFAGNFNLNETNFRILKVDIANFIKNSKCQMPKENHIHVSNYKPSYFG